MTSLQESVNGAGAPVGDLDVQDSPLLPAARRVFKALLMWGRYYESRAEYETSSWCYAMALEVLAVLAKRPSMISRVCAASLNPLMVACLQDVPRWENKEIVERLLRRLLILQAETPPLYGAVRNEVLWFESQYQNEVSKLAPPEAVREAIDECRMVGSSVLAGWELALRRGSLEAFWADAEPTSKALVDEPRKILREAGGSQKGEARIQPHSLAAKLYFGIAVPGLVQRIEMDYEREFQTCALSTFLAYHLFRVREGKYPLGPEGLVPRFLPILPVDPLTGRILCVNIKGDRLVVTTGKLARGDSLSNYSALRPEGLTAEFRLFGPHAP
jgi:hypothetical protein